MPPTATADPNTAQPYLDQAQEQKNQRLHTAVFGGQFGYGDTKAPMYVGHVAPKASGNLTPQEQAITDRFFAQHSWMTPEQADAQRWQVLQKMGWQGQVPAGMPGGPPAPASGVGGAAGGVAGGTGGFTAGSGVPTGNTALEQQIQATLGQYLQGGPGNSPALAAAKANFEANVLPMLQAQATLAGTAESPGAVQMYGNVLAGQMVPLIQADMQNQLAAAQQGMALSGQQFQQGFLPWQAQASGQLTREQMGQERYLTEQAQALQRQAQQQQFQLGQGAQALERELGLGSQGLQRELGLGQLGLETELGLGRLGLDTEMGRGQLGLQGQQLSQAGAQAAAQIADAQARRQLDAYGLAGNLMLGLSNPYTAAMQGQLGQQQNALSAFSQFGALQQGTAQQVLDQMRMEYLRQQGLAEGMSTGLFGGSVLPPSLGQSASTSGSTSK